MGARGGKGQGDGPACQGLCRRRLHHPGRHAPALPPASTRPTPRLPSLPPPAPHADARHQPRRRGAGGRRERGRLLLRHLRPLRRRRPGGRRQVGRRLHRLQGAGAGRGRGGPLLRCCLRRLRCLCTAIGWQPTRVTPALEQSPAGRLRRLHQLPIPCARVSSTPMSFLQLSAGRVAVRPKRPLAPTTHLHSLH